MVKAIRAYALILLLACSAQAGDMQNDSPAPPSQPATTVQVPVTDGDMQNDVADGIMGNDAASIFMQVVLNLLTLP